MGQQVSVEAQQSGMWYITIPTSSAHARTIEPNGTPVICHLKKVMKPGRDGVQSTGLEGGKTLIHLLILESLSFGKSGF